MAKRSCSSSVGQDAGKTENMGNLGHEGKGEARKGMARMGWGGVNQGQSIPFTILSC